VSWQFPPGQLSVHVEPTPHVIGQFVSLQFIVHDAPSGQRHVTFVWQTSVMPPPVASMPPPVSFGEASIPPPVSFGEASTPPPVSFGEASVPPPASFGAASVTPPVSGVDVASLPFEAPSMCGPESALADPSIDGVPFEPSAPLLAEEQPV